MSQGSAQGVKRVPATVIDHVLSRLKDIGITKIFGVPGDYDFTVSDAIVNFPGIEWVGCCNELNAAYAADGYARVNGVAAVNQCRSLFCFSGATRADVGSVRDSTRRRPPRFLFDQP